MTARTPAARAGGGRHGDAAPRGTGLVLIVVCTAILLDALDLSITQIALPSIQRGLDLSTGNLQWVANAYVLTYGGFLLLSGRLADLTGRRRVLLLGLALFGAMSLAGGLAPNALLLGLARALQGIGAAFTFPAAIAIIAASFPEGPERSRALSVFGAAGATGFSAGLVLGGIFTDLLSWRWIFLAKAPIVLAIALITLRVVAADRPTRQARSYDLGGAVASTAGLVLLVVVITQLAQRTVPVPALVAAAVLAAALLAGFVINERRVTDPLLPPWLLRLRTLRYADLASLTVLAAPFGFSYICTLYLQNVAGYSALRTSFALLPGAALSAVVSRLVAPALMRRWGLRLVGSGGLLLAATGFLLLASLHRGSPYPSVVLPAVVVCLGLGMGIAYPVYTIGGTTGVPDGEQGVAAGVQSTALQVGGGLCLALVSAGVAARLGTAPGSADYVAALHTGVYIGSALPFLGAVVTALGLPGASVATTAPLQTGRIDVS